MPHSVETILAVRASAESVWAIISDFSSVKRYSAKVESSPIVGDTTHGLGTKRKCTFYDKSTVTEEIVEYEEGRSLRIALSEYSMPLKSLHAEMKVLPIDDTSCQVSFGMEYVVKFGPIGWVMGTVMMKPLMRGVTKNVLNGLAYHVVTGNDIGTALPTADELRLALV